MANSNLNDAHSLSHTKWNCSDNHMNQSYIDSFKAFGIILKYIGSGRRTNYTDTTISFRFSVFTRLHSLGGTGSSDQCLRINTTITHKSNDSFWLLPGA